MAATNGLDLNQVQAFVQVMESGSFTAAARALALPKSSISRRVSALEDALRVRLLQRTTRKLVLTEAGRLYFERARVALGGLAEASDAVADMGAEIAGPIRFTGPDDASGLIASLMNTFLSRYPKVQIDVVLTPRRVDLVAEGFDLALRAGPLVDSSLVVRRLGRTDLGIFASRGYLRSVGRPRTVAELAKHRFILFGEAPQRNQLRIMGPDGEQTIKIDGPLVGHSMSFMADAIAAGIGVGIVPELYLGMLAKAGLRALPDLVRLLPEYGVPGADFSLVSPPTAYEPTRVTLLRDFIAAELRPWIARCAVVIAEQKEAGRRRAVRRSKGGREKSFRDGRVAVNS